MVLTYAGCGVGTAICLLFWKKRGIRDIPDHRSSHEVATPTGAGVCFASTFCLVEIFEWFAKGSLSSDRSRFLFGLAVLVVVGLVDDRKEIDYKFRLGAHLLAVGALLAAYPFDLAYGFSLALLGVGLINACNFLDGIDGFLAGQWLLTMGFLLAAFFPESTDLWSLWVGVAVFFAFNFPKAKLFMGDTGSTVLGYAYFYAILGVISSQNVRLPSIAFRGDLSILFCLAPMGLAWGDIAITLLNRISRGRSLVRSYKDYGFHRLTAYFGNHVAATLGYLSCNAFLAYLAYRVITATPRG